MEKATQPKQTTNEAELTVAPTDTTVYELMPQTKDVIYPVTLTERKQYGQMVPCFSVKLMPNYHPEFMVPESSQMVVHGLAEENVNFQAKFIIGYPSKKTGNQSIVLQITGTLDDEVFNVAGKALTPDEKRMLKIKKIIRKVK